MSPEYIEKHQEVGKEVADSMREYSVRRGMTKEQVEIIASPDSKDYAGGQDVWIYGSILQDGRMLRLTFKNDKLSNIDVKYWTYTIAE